MPIKERSVLAYDYNCDRCGASRSFVVDNGEGQGPEKVRQEEDFLKWNGWIILRRTSKGHFWRTGIEGREVNRVFCPQCSPKIDE